MSYVYNGKIYSEHQVYRKIRKPIRTKLSEDSLNQLGVYKLTESAVPTGDVVVPLDTATLVNGNYERDYNVRSYTPEELSAAKDVAYASVNVFYQSKVDGITEFYPEFEQATWKWQYEEALALQADPQAASPIIDKVVQWSGNFTKAQYVTYLINNMPVYLNVAGKHVGLLLDAKIAIKNCTTRAEIDAVVNGVLQS